MADVNALIGIAETAAETAQASPSSWIGNIRGTIMMLLNALALLFKSVLEYFGIVLPASGYVIVAAFALGALAYYLHKMTWGMLKAVLIGIVVAVVLSMVGVLR